MSIDWKHYVGIAIVVVIVIAVLAKVKIKTGDTKESIYDKLLK